MAEIHVYGAAWCMPCRQAKRWMDNKGIGYTYHDVDTEDGAMAYIEGLGYNSIPVIVRDGESKLGFNPKDYADLIKEN